MKQASHETVVSLIRKSGDLVKLTVVTVAFEPALIQPQPAQTQNGLTNNRQYSTLPRKLSTNGNRTSIQPPPPPKRDPSTTLSVGRARARSMVANMAALEALDKVLNEHDSSTSESVTGSVDSVQRMPDLVVQAEEQNNNKSKVYASVSEMKRMKVLGQFPVFPGRSWHVFFLPRLLLSIVELLSFLKTAQSQLKVFLIFFFF